MTHRLVALTLAATALTGCREEEVTLPAETDYVGDERPESGIRGLYLVNEGNMGSNKCTLDYYDFTTGLYMRNLYGERNPTAVKELGDVGNDAGVYGTKLYVTVNCSHKVEVMDAATGIRLGQVDIPNCRSLLFHEGRVYVSSFVGPVGPDPGSPRGQVWEVDTATLAVTRRVTVGYQPEEMAVVGGRLYVANSGAYRAPEYDNTVSVVRLSDLRQTAQLAVGENLHRMRLDPEGNLWVTGRGDNADGSGRLYVLRPDARGEYAVTDTLDTPCSNIALHGHTLYHFSASAGGAATYGAIDTRTMEPLGSWIADGTETAITMPYGLAVHPESGDIYVTDAKNYVSSGTLHCYSPEGRLRWSVRTGDIPAHIAFLPR